MALYLAYGMNTNIDQMASRCPGSVSIGRVDIPDHRLVFRGVADIEVVLVIPYRLLCGTLLMNVKWLLICLRAFQLSMVRSILMFKSITKPIKQ